MRKCFLRNILFVVAAFGCHNTTIGQNYEAGMRVDATFKISERWDIDAYMKGAFNNCGADYIWVRTGANLKFTIYNNTKIFLGTIVGGAKYLHIENLDAITTLVEGIQTMTKAKFEHKLIFEQRSLYFYPSEYMQNCSRFTYVVGRNTQIGKSGKYLINTEAAASFNIRSDIDDCEYLQRIKLKAGIVRHLTQRIDVGVNYTYMFGGKRQVYFDEANDYHAVVVVVSWH